MPAKSSKRAKSGFASTRKEKATASLVGLSIYVEDIERSFDYYSKIPDAVVLHHSKGEFAMLRIGSKFRLGLIHAMSKGFHIEFESANIDVLYAKMSSSKSGANVAARLAKRPWGERSFTMKDPDGYQVEFEDGGSN